MKNFIHFLKMLLCIFTINFIGFEVYAQPGTNDPMFNTFDNGIFGDGSGFDGFIKSFVIQPDGKIVVGGTFTKINGVARNRIARLNADGSLDLSFNPGTGFNNIVYALALQADGKIVVGGTFTHFKGNPLGRIVRLNANGSQDFTFNTGSGFNEVVWGITLQDDGQILVGGNFTTFGGVGRNRITRLNTNGSFDNSFNFGTGFNDDVRSMAIQDDGKIFVVGDFSNYNGTANNRISKLNTDGTLDDDFEAGLGFNTNALTVSIQENGKIVVGGNFITYMNVTRNRIARLNVDGSLDATFNPGTGFNNSVWSTAIQSDGKIIVGGQFTTFNNASKNRIVRLNTDGTTDATFNIGTGFTGGVGAIDLLPDGKILAAGEFIIYNGGLKSIIAILNNDGNLFTSFNRLTGFNARVRAIKVLNTEKILVCGNFSAYNDYPISRIARLNSDGTLDNTFNLASGLNVSVATMVVQDDGKIIIGGNFTTFNGNTINRIARLNSDGTLDLTFNPGTGANGTIWTIALQQDGKIVIGGEFTSFAGVGRNRIARLNDDGSLDPTFNPGTGANEWIYASAIQNDGKIIIGGEFTNFNGTGSNRIARLNTNGTLDVSFHPGTGFNNAVRTLSLQSDGKILAGGAFTAFNNVGVNRLTRLNSDGSTDATFNIGTGIGNALSSSIQSLVIRADGKILIGGDFSSFNGTPRTRIAMLNANGELNTEFTPGSGFNNTVYATTFDMNGKVIAGGDFTSFDGTPRTRIARLFGLNNCQTVLGTDIISSCAPITWIDGITYNASNNSATHLIVGGAASGCDSLVTLNLTITPSLSPTFSTLGAFCQGATIPALPTTSLNGINGSWSPAIDNQQTMNYAFTPHGGQCATPTTMTVEILPIITGVHTIASCAPITWIDGITYNASNNSATHLIVGGAASGCDSLVTLNLTITPCSQLTPTFCGASNVGWNSDVQAIHVAGAQSYRFRIVGNNIGNTWVNNTAIHFSNDRVFRFSEINGTYWGQTYQVDVAVSMNGVDYGPYNTVCSVTLENIPSPSMSTTICSSGAASGGTNVSFTTINGALGYRFRIVGNNTAGWLGNTLEFNSASNSFQFNNIPGMIWGQSYAVSAAILSQDGVTYGNYGPACSLTFSFPTTALLPTSCGITGVGLNTVLRAGGNANATGYLFRITGANSGTPNWIGGSALLPSLNRTMRFADVQGVLPGQTYQIEVAFRAQDGVTYGPFGALCSVTLSNVLMQGLNPDGEINTSLFEVASSHNPFTESFGLQVVTDKIDEWVYITIYDMSGKQIETKQVAPLDIEGVRFGQNLASGMYMIELRQGSNQVVIRQVKN